MMNNGLSMKFLCNRNGDWDGKGKRKEFGFEKLGNEGSLCQLPQEPSVSFYSREEVGSGQEGDDQNSEDLHDEICREV